MICVADTVNTKYKRSLIVAAPWKYNLELVLYSYQLDILPLLELCEIALDPKHHHPEAGDNESHHKAITRGTEYGYEWSFVVAASWKYIFRT